MEPRTEFGVFQSAKSLREQMRFTIAAVLRDRDEDRTDSRAGKKRMSRMADDMRSARRPRTVFRMGAGGEAARYVELEAISSYSFLRGASHPEELVRRAVELGLEALGVADHDSLAGAVRVHVAARAAGLRAIVGARLDLVDAPSVLAYPCDRAAYGRLSRLLTEGKARAGGGARNRGAGPGRAGLEAGPGTGTGDGGTGAGRRGLGARDLLAVAEGLMLDRAAPGLSGPGPGSGAGLGPVRLARSVPRAGVARPPPVAGGT